MITKIDYLVVACYGLLVALLGYVAKRKVKNPEDYFAGGKNVPWWLAAISHHMSGYSAFAFVGYASVAYQIGFATYTMFAPPIFIAMIVGAFIWAPRWAKMKILTPIEYLEQRFNNTVRQVFAWSGIGIKFIDEGAKLYSLSIIVHVVTGWPLVEVIIVCGFITVLYLFFGGLWATVLTDFAQFFVQFCITLILVPIILNLVGGFSGLVGQMPEGHSQVFSNFVTPWFILVYIVVMTLSYNGGTWGLAQRFYSIGKPRDARKAALLSACLYLIYPLAMLIPMWAAHTIVGSIDQPEQVYVLVAQKVLHTLSPGLLGLFVASMFAATMSMVDTDLNAMAAVFTKDIYQRNFNRHATNRHLLRIGMVATVVLGALTIASALLTIHLEGAFKAMLEWFAAILGPVSLPLLLGLVYRKTTPRGALLSWFFGIVTFGFVKYAVPTIWGIETTFPIYTGCELAISLSVFIFEGVWSRPTREYQVKVDEFFRQFDSLPKV